MGHSSMAWETLGQPVGSAFAAGAGQAQGVAHDEAADGEQHDHEGHADVEVGTCLAPLLQDDLLHLDADLDTDFRQKGP